MVWESLIPLIQSFIVKFSYPAIFAISVISSSTIFIPFPIYLVIFFAGGLGLNPLLIGISAGIGSAVGELTGYLVGSGGRALVEEKFNLKSLIKFTKLFKKYGFLIIVITSFLPSPFDIVGILSGVSKYEIKKFLIGTAIGKSARMIILAYTGYIAIPYVELLIHSWF